MSNAAENMRQAASDLLGVKGAIIEKGVTIPYGTPTSEYADKIREIETGGEDVSGLIERSSISYDVPKGVTAIGSYAFAGMNELQSVTIPSSVETIGASAFYGCGALKRIFLPNSIERIKEHAFAQCPSLIVAGLGSASEIGDNAFFLCSLLEKIIISKSVYRIGNSAFFNCTSLTDVYYQGNETEWANIRIENNNTYLLSATIHYNYTGDGSEL